MPKFKIGDIVKPLPDENGYLHSYLIAGENYIVEGYTSDGKVNVSGEFRGHGDGIGWDEEWFELVKEDDSVESIRSKILSIRERRNDLLMEITALDKEEEELVEKLKQRGFVLCEQNEPETPATEKKTVLYAEDTEEDMTNPENWEVGDFVEAIRTSADDAYIVGEVYQIDTIVKELSGYMVYTKIDSNEDETNGWHSRNFKFHSRPL